ncbi:MAG: SMI1/KNR4 family protein [Roseivirga sp.]|nr:SMI1/KNR4 family protein [Roseivirga sp.]
MEIAIKYHHALPSDYLNFLKENPEGAEISFNEYPEEDPDDEGRYWDIMGESELLESWEMSGVGIAMNFESLKLYVQVQREFAFDDSTTSNVGNIELSRVAESFVIGSENGDYLYLDPSDNFSVWVYYHDGGDVLRLADSFSSFIAQ